MNVKEPILETPERSKLKLMKGGDMNDILKPTNYFKFGKCMLRFWGLWPNRKLSPKLNMLYKAYGTLIILTTLIPYNICFVVDTIVQFQLGRWMDMLPRFSVALAMVLGCVKLSVYVFYNKTIEKLMEAYEDDVFTYKSTPFFQPNRIIKRCVVLYNMQVAVCFGLVLLLVMSDIDASMREEIKYLGNVSMPALPFVNWLPYDFSKSPAYELSYALTNFWFFVSADVIFVYDTICMGLMIHTGGQLKILRLALETIRMRVLEEIYFNGEKPTDDNIKKTYLVMIRKCVIHHQAIIRQNTEIQGIFSTMIFLQFFTSCLMVCFTILIVTNINSPVSSRITSSIILLCTMWELSVYCYFGNEIIAESNRLSLSIYMSDWLKMDKSIKVNMLIMMSRAQRPIVFTAGRFVPLSLATFISVLKASYSYYAFLRTVANK